jgi:hypothetical protein
MTRVDQLNHFTAYTALTAGVVPKAGLLDLCDDSYEYD